MIHSIDDLLIVDEMAIHASLEAHGSSSMQPPLFSEHAIREQCRDIITNSYMTFASTVLENPVGIVYDVQKQSAIAALKDALRLKALAATSAEERQIYLNYARVAHLQFAQKAKQLDAVVVAYNQEVPSSYLCSTTGSQPSGICIGLAALSLSLLGMANKRSQKENVKPAAQDGDARSSSPTIVLPQSLSVVYTSGTHSTRTDGADAILVDSEDETEEGNNGPLTGIIVKDERNYIDNGAATLHAKAAEDKIFVEWDEPPTAPGKEKIEEKYNTLEALPAAQQKPKRRGIFAPLAYGAVALLTVATAAVVTLNTVTLSSPTKYETQIQPAVSSEAIAQEVEISQEQIPPPQNVLPYTITYESTNAPHYDAKNLAPWYQIEKATIRDDGKTLDLRLGPYLSMDGRTVRVTYDTNNDGKADRVKYVDSAESLSLTVSGKVIDVGVGFIKEDSPGFTYHSSIRFDQKSSV